MSQGTAKKLVGQQVSADSESVVLSVENEANLQNIDGASQATANYLSAAIVDDNTPIGVGIKGMLLQAEDDSGNSEFLRSSAGNLYVRFASAPTVTVQDGGGSITIDDGGVALTVNGTVFVNDAGGSISVDDNGGSITIDGTVSVVNGGGASAMHIQDGGNSITVDGSVTVSGTIAQVTTLGAMSNDASCLNMQVNNNLFHFITSKMYGY